MLRALKAYPTLLRAFWQRAIEYRFQIVLWLVAGTFPLVLMMVWLTIGRDRSINGYDANAFIGYYLGVVLVRRVTLLWVLDDIEQPIRTGELSSQLIRPLDIGHVVFANIVALRFMSFLVAGTVVGTAALLIPGQQFSLSVANVLLCAGITAIGFVFEFLLQYAIGGLAFWTTQVYRIFDVVFYVKSFLGGFVVPITLMPPAMQTAARWLPFQSSVGLPVEVLVGRASPERVIEGALVSLAWLVVLFVIGRLIWTRGLRSYSAVGA